MCQQLSLNKEKLPKVILFADSDRKRRIEKGYYGHIDNSKDLAIVDFDDFNKDESGIIFKKGEPIRSDIKYSIFLQDEFQPEVYVPMHEYQNYRVGQEKTEIPRIMQLLGICDYIVEYHFYLRAEFDQGKKQKAEAGVDAGSLASMKAKFTGSSNLHVGFGLHKGEKCEWKFRGFNDPDETVTQKNWNEAAKIVEKLHLKDDDDIRGLLKVRQPNDANNPLAYFAHAQKLEFDVAAKMNLASQFGILGCFKGIGADGMLSNFFNFEAEVQGMYVREVIYNFDPKYSENFRAASVLYKEGKDMSTIVEQLGQEGEKKGMLNNVRKFLGVSSDKE